MSSRIALTRGFLDTGAPTGKYSKLFIVDLSFGVGCVAERLWLTSRFEPAVLSLAGQG